MILEPQVKLLAGIPELARNTNGGIKLQYRKKPSTIAYSSQSKIPLKALKDE